MATLLHKRFYGGILLSNTVFSMSVMLLLGASRPASAEISGMRLDVCRTPSPARLVSSTSSHPRPAPVAKCDSGSSPAPRQACTPRSCKYQGNCPMMAADAALVVGGCGSCWRVTVASRRMNRMKVTRSRGGEHMRLLARQASGHSDQQPHRDRAPSSLHLNYVPVILMRSSSGSRWRISSGKRSCTRRAPSLAASRTVTGAGVATATPSHINAERAKPAKAAISSQKA